MYIIYLDWTELKSEIISKGFIINYKKISNGYEVFCLDRQLLWTSNICTVEDIEDFETNYKSKCNKCLYTEDGKQFIRSETKPIEFLTFFTGSGDSDVAIGEGKILKWDFSNDDDTITSPENFKRKRLEFKFLDTVCLKSGESVHKNLLYGSYIDFYIVCPEGNYYLNNNGEPCLAEEDTIVVHYVNKYSIFSDSSQIKNLVNSETCSSNVPNNYKFWIDITVPDTDCTSKGSFLLSIYRFRTVIL